jgi:hypothetical protein
VVTPQPKGFGKEVFAPYHERPRHSRCLVGAYLRDKQFKMGWRDLDEATVSSAE